MELRKIKIKPGSLILIAILTVYSDIAAQFIIAATFHELGHMVAMLAFSAHIEYLEINIGGLAIKYDNYKLSYGQEIVCTASGPAFSLLLAAAAASTGKLASSEFAYVTAGASIALFIFNMLPVSMLDGGRILNQILAKTKGPFFADSFSLLSDIILSASLFIFSSAMTLVGRMNATLPCISAVMLILCCKKAENSVES